MNCVTALDDDEEAPENDEVQIEVDDQWFNTANPVVETMLKRVSLGLRPKAGQAANVKDASSA